MLYRMRVYRAIPEHVAAFPEARRAREHRRATLPEFFTEREEVFMHAPLGTPPVT